MVYDNKIRLGVLKLITYDLILITQKLTDSRSFRIGWKGNHYHSK
jgi:hypothetical protein